jgi:hypothetical protein
MKSMREMTPAWGNAGPEEPPWNKDRLIARLRAEGHEPVSVSRAVIVIEQCDEGDAYTAGWSKDPIRVTVYPDPDAGFGDDPARLVIHAGRAGLMELFCEAPSGTLRMVGVDAIAVERTHDLSSIVAVEAVLGLVAGTLSGYYSVKTDAGAGFEHDEELERLGIAAADAVRAYQKALAAKTNVFRGWEFTD